MRAHVPRSGLHPRVDDPGTEARPWRTLAHAQDAIAPGAVIRFRRGDTFTGSLSITVDGVASHTIVLGAYGTGAAPVLSGLTSVTSWRSLGGGVYEADLPTRTSMLNVVRVGGSLAPIGRYPRATDPDDGWLFLDAACMGSAGGCLAAGTSSITDAALTGTPSFVGAELVVRVQTYVLDRGVTMGAMPADRAGVVTAQSGGTLTFASFPDYGVYPLRTGQPYFLQNHPSCLLDAGDWMFDRATNRIRMRADATPTGVEVSSVDRIVSIVGGSFVRIEDLAFVGANDRAVHTNGASDVSITRCSFLDSGNYAVSFDDTEGASITSSTVTNALSNGVRFNGARRGGFTLRDSVVEHVGTIAGMGEPARNTYEGVYVRTDAAAGAAATSIEGNHIRDVGYNALYFQGSNITIRHDVIEHFCTILDDGGGIYTWNNPAVGGVVTPVFVNRLIEENVVHDGVGYAAGTLDTSLLASGIYLDLDAMNVRVIGNTVYDVSRRAIVLNNPRDVELRGNTLYDVDAVRLTQWTNGQAISGLDASDNVIVTNTSAHETFGLTDLVAASSTFSTRLGAMGTWHDNHVGGWASLPFSVEYADGAGTMQRPDDFHLTAWQAATDLEGATTLLPSVPRHRIDAELGPELYARGSFDTDPAVSTFPASGRATWDASCQCLAVTNDTLSPRTRQQVYAFLDAGVSITAGHQYRMRASVRSLVPNGEIYGTLRVGNTEVAEIIPHAVHEGTEVHEWLLTPTMSATSPRWQIRVMTGAMPVYLDDVSVMEVRGETLAYEDTVRFEVNDGASARTIDLGGVYTDARGVVWDRSITLAPYTSAVLFPGGVVPPHDAGVDLDAGPSVDAGLDVDLWALDAWAPPGRVSARRRPRRPSRRRGPCPRRCSPRRCCPRPRRSDTGSRPRRPR